MVDVKAYAARLVSLAVRRKHNQNALLDARVENMY